MQKRRNETSNIDPKNETETEEFFLVNRTAEQNETLPALQSRQ